MHAPWHMFTTEDHKLQQESNRTLEAIRRRKERRLQASAARSVSNAGESITSQALGSKSIEGSDELLGDAAEDIRHCVLRLENACASRFNDVVQKLDTLSSQVLKSVGSNGFHLPTGVQQAHPPPHVAAHAPEHHPGANGTDRPVLSRGKTLPNIVRLPRLMNTHESAAVEPPSHLPSSVHNIEPPDVGSHPWLEPLPPWTSEASIQKDISEDKEEVFRYVGTTSAKFDLKRQMSIESVKRKSQGQRDWGGTEPEDMVPSMRMRSERSDRGFDERERKTSLDMCSSAGLDVMRARIAGQRKRGIWARRIWHFLEEADSSRGALVFSWLLPSVVMMNTIFCFMQTTEDTVVTSNAALVVHLVFDMLFAAEVLVRFVVCPNRNAFFCNTANWIDVVAGIPIFLSIPRYIIETDSTQNRVIFEIILVFPVIRLLKVLRSFEKFHLLEEAFWIAFEALPVLLYTLSVIVITFTVILYFVEKVDGEVSSLPEACWLTIVTMMTVGYGDVVPRTAVGHIIISILIVMSALYMAVPLGIVGGSFSRVWEDRDRLMLIRRTRMKLLKCGYGPKDILELFYLYDSNKSGELDLGEFALMITDMQLGIGTDRVANLFKTFDSDGSGKVDDEEFVRALFPKAYHSIYQEFINDNESLQDSLKPSPLTVS